jgi:hypothetical protein
LLPRVGLAHRQTDRQTDCYRAAVLLVIFVVEPFGPMCVRRELGDGVYERLSRKRYFDLDRHFLQLHD